MQHECIRAWIEIKLPESEAPVRLRRIESWCGGWEMRVLVLDRKPPPETIRLAFQENRLARAFIGHFGSVLVGERKIKDAMGGDVAFENIFERLARESNE